MQRGAEQVRRVRFQPTPVGALLYGERPRIGELGCIAAERGRWLEVAWDLSGALLVRAADIILIDERAA